MDKRSKLTPLRNVICIDPEFYRSQNSQETIPVTRLLMFGKYLEGELDQQSSDQLRLHLEKCSFCAAEFQELKNVDDLSTAGEVAVRVCPSSSMLDHYQFDRATLSATQITKIEVHLQKCTLCAEELEWLRNLEGSRKKRESYSYTWFQSALGRNLRLKLRITNFAH
jgi:hypothetical protein